MEMVNKKYVIELVERTKHIPAIESDDEILDLYYEVIGVLESDKYSEEEKEYIKKHAYLEMLRILQDGIERERGLID